MVLLAFNPVTTLADVAEKRPSIKHCCSSKTDNRPIKTHKAECPKNPSTNVSWVAWLTGDSRSNQFHYLDLLELLFRDEQNSETPPTT